MVGLAGLLSIILAIVLGTDIWVVQYRYPTPAVRYTSPGAQPAPPKDTLTIMTWNIKFGGKRA